MSEPRPEAVIEPTPCVWMGDYDTLPEGEWAVGWCFYWKWFGDDLSPHYLNNVASIRPPITVMCPTNFGPKWKNHATPFCVDHLSTDKREPWTVTVDMDSLILGQKPLITVNPSIHLIGIWHGWLQEGILHN